MKTIHLIYCLLALLSLNVLAQESDEIAINTQLQSIKQRLTELKSSLNSAQGQEAKLLSELEQQDQKINAQGKLIRTGEQKIQLTEQQIKALAMQIKTLNDSISEQKQQMAKLLRLHIYISQDRLLKMLLLNSGNRSVDMTQHQIKFLQHRLYSLIEDIASQIQQLATIQKQTETKNTQLTSEQNTLQQAQQQLLTQKQQRSLVLEQLRTTIRSYQTESDSLNNDRSRLNQLLKELTQLLDDLPEDLGNNANFLTLKGHLVRPVSGAIIRKFGALRAGYSRWDGIVIADKSGNEVKAGAYGRVAFADWLRGYGLLVVIDHGADYMSLYGHNQSLLVQAIATAGQSGSVDQSGV